MKERKSRMAAKVAINGLGRIGRAALKLVVDTPELELVAVNDIGSLENMAYLLRYDTVYGRYGKSVEVGDGELVVGGHASPTSASAIPPGYHGASSVSSWSSSARACSLGKRTPKSTWRLGRGGLLSPLRHRARECRRSFTASTGPRAAPRSSLARAAQPTTSRPSWRS